MTEDRVDETAALPKFRQRYRKSEVIFEEGSTGSEMYLMDDSPRSATASAVEDGTELFVMDRARFLFMVRQQPEFALSLMHTLCRRIRDMDKRLSPEGVSQ
jgi:hypothetical protein